MSEFVVILSPLSFLADSSDFYEKKLLILWDFYESTSKK
jgi:hypothetical protein